MLAAVPTYVLTGVASGMGRATKDLLESDGHRVIGVDRHEAEVVADLSSPTGREAAVEAVTSLSGGVLDGAAMFAGLVGATGRAASLLVSVNYFGTVELLVGLRPLLAAAGESAALVMSSNSVTIQPRWSQELVAACLAGDEHAAGVVADRADSLPAYPATKAALARWVRRLAPSADWAGAGIRLNALAPGMVETAMVAETRADPVLGKLIDAMPMPLGRGGKPEELAALAAFLLGPHGRYFCGSVVLCDGGTEALLRPDDWPARWELG
jgi:NAD(P)-dependent dehydrogenase (short-subunit alcohol dehydrogenase family)